MCIMRYHCIDINTNYCKAFSRLSSVYYCIVLPSKSDCTDGMLSDN